MHVLPFNGQAQDLTLHMVGDSIRLIGNHSLFQVDSSFETLHASLFWTILIVLSLESTIKVGHVQKASGQRYHEDL